MTEEEKKEHRLKIKCAEVARYRVRYPERIAAYRREYIKKNPEYMKRKKESYNLRHPEKVKARIARRRANYKARYPERVKLEKMKARIRKMFVGVVDVETNKLLLETKMLQLNIKKLLKHGEANEEHR
jgi:hypothetical protein